MPEQQQEKKETAQEVWDALDKEEANAAQAPDAKAEEAAPESVEQSATPAETEEKPAVTPTASVIAGDPAIQQQLAELTQLVKSTVGRVGSMQSELQKIGKAAADSANNAPSGKQIDKASQDPDAWKKLKDDFPDWAEGVEAFVSTRIPGSQPTDVSAVVKPLEERIAELAKQREEDAMEMVATVDPKWQQKTQSKEFADWVKTKDEKYQEMVNTTWKPSQVLSIVRDFDQAQAAAQAPEAGKQQNDRLASAAIPRGNAKPNVTKSVEEMNPKEYWAYLDAQERKKAR